MDFKRTILDCGGKRSATPLSSGRNRFNKPMVCVRAKALSPLRFASAVQNANCIAKPFLILSIHRAFMIHLPLIEIVKILFAADVAANAENVRREGVRIQLDVIPATVPEKTLVGQQVVDLIIRS